MNDPTILLGSETGSKIRVCGSGCQVQLSEPVLISGLGINHMKMVMKKMIKGQPMFTHTIVGADISLK